VDQGQPSVRARVFKGKPPAKIPKNKSAPSSFLNTQFGSNLASEHVFHEHVIMSVSRSAAVCCAKLSRKLTFENFSKMSYIIISGIRFSSELTLENVFRNVVPHGGRQSIVADF